MFSKFVNLFFTWVFFLNTIQYNINGAAGQKKEVLISIMFLPVNQSTKTFFTDQLAPVFEDLSKCVDWDIYPIYIPQHKTDLDELYQCAYCRNKLSKYNLAKFYVCMITGGDQLSHAQDCATKTGIDWPTLNACKITELTLYPDKVNSLEVKINYILDQNLMTKFKDTVCNKLKSMSKPCAGCQS